ncbi:MAG: LysR family transcriptional regulator [Myxococcaceae bacterium]
MRLVHVRNLDLNLLVAFSELLEGPSVTAAATRLGITQPAMSRTLARLREAFHDPLFVRTRAGLRPTPRATELSTGVREVLEATELLVAGPERFDPATAQRTFTVSTADYGEQVMLPGLLARLTAEAPGVSVRVTVQPASLEGALERGDLDLAWTPRVETPRTVVWTPLLHEEFGFVVRRGHPVLKQGAFTLERYLSLRHVAIAPAGRSNANPLDERLARMGKRRAVVATVPTFLVVPSLVAGSDLGATLPMRLIEPLAARFDLVTLDLPLPNAGFGFEQAWHERMRKDPAHAWFRHLVMEVAKAKKTPSPLQRRGSG